MMLLASLALLACPKPTTDEPAEPVEQPAPVVREGPQGVMDRLAVAVERRDRAALIGCFAADSRMRAHLEGADMDWDRMWSELDGALRGPQTLTVQGDWRAVPVGGDVRGRVEAPVAKGGGVGGLTFRHTSDGWAILAW